MGALSRAPIRLFGKICLLRMVLVASRFGVIPKGIFMNFKMTFLVFVASLFAAPMAYAEACGSINKDIADLQMAIGHIKEHGQITPEDSKEVVRDLKVAKKDLQAILKSGEAPGEEAEMIKQAIAALDETIKGLKKGDMSRVVGGLEQMVSVLIQYRDHHHCAAS